jgi:hypothetical protein
LKRTFNLRYDRVDFFAKPHPSVPPSPELVRELEATREMPLLSEKAKSEFLIAPILRELYRMNPGRFTLFSGIALDVDELLNEYCDYLFSRKPRSLEVTAPIFCLVEAKNRTLEEGLGQCAAEVYAAWKLNEEANEPIETVYGAVTTGFEWVFLRFSGQEIQIDLDRFYLNELPKLLGALHQIVANP